MSNRVKSIPEGFHTLTPGVIVQDAMEAMEFYKKVFGAKVRRAFKGSEGKMVHAELQIGDSIIMLSDEFPMMHVLSPKSPGGGTSISLYMYIDDVDKVFADAVSAGASVKMPLTDSFWGDRCGTIVDPFGHIWMLATHKKDLTDEELEKAMKETSEAIRNK